MQKTLNVRTEQLLDYISCTSELARSFLWGFGDENGRRLLGIVWFVLCNRAPLQEIEQWQTTHTLPWPEKLSRIDCELLFIELCSDSSKQKLFFQGRNERLRYSAGQGLLVELPELHLLMLCSTKYHEPLSFAHISEKLPRGEALSKARQELKENSFPDAIREFISDEAEARRILLNSADFVRQQHLFGLAPLEDDIDLRISGRIFICFAALCLYHAVEHKLNLARQSATSDLKQLLEHSGGRQTAMTVVLEDLLSWLEPLTVQDLLLWFDEDHSANAVHGSDSGRLCPENLARDVIFLRYFGYSDWTVQKISFLLD